MTTDVYESPREGEDRLVGDIRLLALSGNRGLGCKAKLDFKSDEGVISHLEHVVV